MYIVELQKGVWLAKWEGDPGRTLIKVSAKQFKRKGWAKRALKMARKYRPFVKGKVTQLTEH
jgi:hypothetical protein